MARNIQAELEHEADKKGLEGEERKRYIGGAWQRIRHGNERRAWWQSHADNKALSALVGPVQELRFNTERKKVVFRQGKNWYELPESEYQHLVREGHAELKERERREKKERDDWEKAKRIYERELARINREEEREEKRRARETDRAKRAEEREREYQDRVLRAAERAEYSDVVAIIKRAGGIRRGKGGGKETERAEYNALPSTVKARRGREVRAFGENGMTPDETATLVNSHMPWLNIETPNDLYDYFDRHATYRMHHTGRGAA